MLEFVIVFLLARRNGRAVEAKGVSGTKYRWGTAGLWFGCEILGAIVGAMLMANQEDISGVYLLALGGAVIGGCISYVWANSVVGNPMAVAAASWFPTHLTPPNGLQAWAAPDPAQPPVTTIPGNVELVLMEKAGQWAHVRAFNGFVAWVDGDLLVSRYQAPVFNEASISQG